MDTPDYTPVPKTCTKCKTCYPDRVKSFSKNKKTKDGFNGWCKNCINQWRAEHREEVLEKKRAYYAVLVSDPSKKQRLLEKSRDNKRRYSADGRYKNKDKQYRIKNRSRRAKYNRDWKSRNPNWHPAYKREYDRRNRERCRMHKLNRKARIRSVGGTIKRNELRALVISSEGKCRWCGKDVGDRYHFDHIIPVSKGGTNTIGNVCVSCPDCNLRKNDMLPDEWMTIIQKENGN